MSNSPNPYDLPDLLKVATEAAHSAGFHALNLRSTLEVNSDGLEINYKGLRNLVTKADVEAESLILSKIRAHYPTHAVLAEESISSGHSKDELHGPLWIIDPIDGTTNFARGHSHFATSIAFADNGVLVAGVVHSPAQKETFTAIRGQGAFLNGLPIRCSDTKDLDKALIATGFPYERVGIDPLIRQAHVTLLHCADLRRLGACSLDMCWVACGRLDGYYETVMPWDMAAGALIIREAGGALGHTSPERSSEFHDLPDELLSENLLVSNSVLFERLLSLLSGHEN